MRTYHPHQFWATSVDQVSHTNGYPKTIFFSKNIYFPKWFFSSNDTSDINAWYQNLMCIMLQNTHNLNSKILFFFIYKIYVPECQKSWWFLKSKDLWLSKIVLRMSLRRLDWEVVLTRRGVSKRKRHIPRQIYSGITSPWKPWMMKTYFKVVSNGSKYHPV